MPKQAFLIVKMSAIGDILHALDVAQYLKKRFSGCFIAWVVEERFKELVEASPYVDEVIAVNMRLVKGKPLRLITSLPSFRKQLSKYTYDVVFDLQGNCKSALMVLLCKAKDKVGFGRKSVPEWPNVLVARRRIEIDVTLQIAKQYLSLVKSYFHDKEESILSPHLLKTESFSFPSDLFKEENSKQVMVCPGSNWINKQLSENTLFSFLHKIKKKYDPIFVFIWGNRQEEELAIRLQKVFPRSKVAGALPLAIWQALMLRMHSVISVDSCALHLAALAQVPTFSIYGPSSSKVYKPEGSFHVACQGVCPYQVNFIKRCQILRTCKTGACIKEIDSMLLMKDFEILWKEN